MRIRGRKKRNEKNFWGSSSEIAQNLFVSKRRAPHFYSRLRDKIFRRLFLCLPPIDSFSGYFKKLTEDIFRMKLWKAHWHRYLLELETGMQPVNPAGYHHKINSKDWFNSGMPLIIGGCHLGGV